ncbi:MAG: hypothetical protein JW936_08970 [Sedimentisphaerales bacterium]|nr:hypothetical protein [Sedimentisphaerales bacterium]
MMKLRLLMVVALSLLCSSWVLGETVYSCDFEQGEQGLSFTVDPCWLAGQGTPAWSAGFLPGSTDGSGDVVDTAGFLSDQSLYLTGYHTNWLDLGEVTRAQWFAFAFKPNLPDSDDPNYSCWIGTTRGGPGDMTGISMWLNNETKRIMVRDNDVDADMGPWTNHQWHTIAFYHQSGGFYFSGRFDVYVNGNYAGTASSESIHHYNGLGTIVFSSGHRSFYGTPYNTDGDWFIDSIYIGDEPRFQTLEDCETVAVLGLNLAGDLSEDCYVNEVDLYTMGSDWLDTGSDMRSDIAPDDVVNLPDFAILANDWLRCADPTDADCGTYVKKAAVIGSEYIVTGEYADYEPGAMWDNNLQYLGYEVTKLASKNMADWADSLGQYDLVLFTALYEADPNAELVNWSDLGDELADFISEGGLVIMEGVRSNYASVDWLTSVNASWDLTVNDRLSGLPDWTDPCLMSLHSLPDGPEVVAYYTARIPEPAAPDFANGGITVSGGTVLATNRNDNTTIWTDTMGDGRIIVTTYFKGYALDKYMFENLLAWCEGAGYTPVFEEGPTVAEQVATFEPAGSNTSPITVTVNDDSILEIDGSPFFPFGFYKVTYGSLSTVSTNGFNFTMNPTDILDFSAWSFGLRTTYQMPWDTSMLPARINGDTVNAGLIIRDMGQQPSYWTTPVSNYFFRVRSGVASNLDSDRPNFVVMRNPASFEGYVEIGDMSTIEPFCISDSTSSLAKIADDIDAVEEITYDGSVLVLLQAFYEADEYSWPTSAQLRGEMYVALAAGANGIVWHALEYFEPEYQTIKKLNGTYQEPQWTTLKELADEFADIESFIIGSDDTVTVSVLSPSSGVYAAVFTRTASPEHLLVVVNSESSSQSVTLSWPLDISANTALWDSPAISVDTVNDQITLSLTGYQRGAYTFDE